MYILSDFRTTTYGDIRPKSVGGGVSAVRKKCIERWRRSEHALEVLPRV